MKPVGEIRNLQQSLRLLLIHLLFLSALPGACSLAQAQSSAQGLGMAEAYTTLARGVQAAWWNPANLAFSQQTKLTAILASAHSRLANNTLSYSLISKYYGAELSGQEIKDLLSHVPDEGMISEMESVLNYVSFSMGHFALGMQLVIQSQTNVQEELLDVIFNNEIDHSTPKVMDDPLAGQMISYSSMIFAYGSSLKLSRTSEIAFGASMKVLDGIKYARLSSVNVAGIAGMKYFDMQGDYSLVFGNGGLGSGIDLGMNARFKKRFHLAVFLQNVYSRIPWNRSVMNENGVISNDNLQYLNYDTKKQKYTTNWKSNTSWQKEKTSLPGFSTTLPRIAVFGTSISGDKLDLAVSYFHCLSTDAFFNTGTKLSVGMQCRLLQMLPLRGGIVWNEGKRDYAIGFGLHPFGFIVDIGLISAGDINPLNAHDIHLALDLGIALQ